jgi:hypothetical protein
MFFIEVVLHECNLILCYTVYMAARQSVLHSAIKGTIHVLKHVHKIPFSFLFVLIKNIL